MDMEFTENDLAVHHGVLHFAQYGEGDLGREVHQDEIGRAGGHLFQQASYGTARRQQIEGLGLPQH